MSNNKKEDIVVEEKTEPMPPNPNPAILVKTNKLPTKLEFSESNEQSPKKEEE